MSTKLSFADRAARCGDNALAAYLYRLISIKKTNLCVSADVHSTTALLRLAEEVGDHICVLKTHADIIDDFGERAIKGLVEISRRKRFLVFEDRKFGDIGNTVLHQYARGPLQIASWAHIVNAHIFPGPSVVTALKAGAELAVKKLAAGVYTEIYVGTPEVSDNEEDEDIPEEEKASKAEKKRSVMATTTIYQTFNHPIEHESGKVDNADRLEALRQLGEPPLSRALLLFAQMSSEDNLMDASYTKACVDVAQKNRDFVMGFISQKSLNESPDDHFISFTPGVKLPPPTADGEQKVDGDGLGQQYRTPEQVVLKDGSDIVIVGRGIIAAGDPKSEAERYQEEAWKAYESRIGATQSDQGPEL